MKHLNYIINERLYLLLLICSAIFISCSEPETKIACVGDSITEGYGLAWQSKTAYPVILDSLLGNGFQVQNCGRSATNMQRKADFPYWICKEFSNVFAYQPDIIIIKLGTNDTKPYNWNADRYAADYQAMIDTFSTMASKPEIILCLPVPVFKTVWEINDSTVVNGVIPVIHKIAQANNLPVIDLYNGLKCQGANFPDSIHPNEEAVALIAKIIADEIKKIQL